MRRRIKSAAEILRETAAADPEAHARALGRAYGVGPASDWRTKDDQELTKEDIREMRAAAVAAETQVDGLNVECDKFRGMIGILADELDVLRDAVAKVQQLCLSSPDRGNVPALDAIFGVASAALAGAAPEDPGAPVRPVQGD